MHMNWVIDLFMANVWRLFLDCGTHAIDVSFWFINSNLIFDSLSQQLFVNALLYIYIVDCTDK